MDEVKTLPSQRKRGRPKKVTLTPRTDSIRDTVRNEAPVKLDLRAPDPRDWGEYPDDDGVVDRFHIPKSMFPEGFDLRWVRTATAGKPDPGNIGEAQRKGWQVVNGQDFQGLFDGMFMPKGHKGPIEIDGLTLHVRPLTFSIKAKMRDHRNAVEQVRRKEADMRGGNLPGVGFDTQHPTVRSITKVNKTIETIVVPDA